MEFVDKFYSNISDFVEWKLFGVFFLVDGLYYVCNVVWFYGMK